MSKYSKEAVKRLEMAFEQAAFEYFEYMRIHLNPDNPDDKKLLESMEKMKYDNGDAIQPIGNGTLH